MCAWAREPSAQSLSPPGYHAQVKKISLDLFLPAVNRSEGKVQYLIFQFVLLEALRHNVQLLNGLTDRPVITDSDDARHWLACSDSLIGISGNGFEIEGNQYPRQNYGFLRQLSRMAGVTVRDAGVERCGLVSFTVAGREADEVQRTLARARINVSVSRVSSTRLDMEARGLPDLVRASVHYYNTAEEIERFCRVLASR